MSHFTVLVLGDDPEKQLAPYHEFECTGTDEFIQDIDITEERRAEYEADTCERLKAPDGSLHSFFDNDGNWRPEFSKADPDAAAWDKGRRREYIPHGYTKVTVSTKDVESFANYIEGYSGQRTVSFGEQPDLDGEHKYGYVLLDAEGNVTKAIDRTNPNKKWDCYQLGGRWTGFFTLKPGSRGKPGKPGLMTEEAPAGKADAARWSDIDFTAMRDEAERKARVRYKKFFTLLGDNPVPQTFEAMRKAHPDSIDNARTAFWAQSGIETVKKDDEFSWDLDPAEFSVSEDQHAEKARERALSTFALVKDGQWFEKGSMGWWGCVANEKEQDQWNREFSKFLDSVNSNTLLSVYDCHI
jgi:hypothetical protein